MINQDLIKQAELYFSQNLVVFPLGAGDSGKAPFREGWNVLRISDVNISQLTYFNALGVQLPAEIIVVDVDNHDAEMSGNKGLNEIDLTYNQKLFELSQFVVKTANNGYHLYFKRPLNFLNNKLKNKLQNPNFKGVEFKSSGRYVIIPDSIIKDNKTYKIVKGSIKNELTYLPTEIVQDLIAPKIVEHTVESDALTLDAEEDVKNFIEKLKSISPLMAGSRSEGLFKIAADAKNYGITPTRLLPILVSWGQDNIHPPITKDDIKQRIINGYNYASGATGSKSMQTIFPKLEKKPKIKVEKTAGDEELPSEPWHSQLKTDKKGNVSKGIFGTWNTEIFLENLEEFKGNLALNLFTMDTVWKEMPNWRKLFDKHNRAQKIKNAQDEDKAEQHPTINDDDIVAIRGILNDKVGFDPSPAQIFEATRAVALRNSFHPVKEYLNSLAPWDGERRLNTFFHKYCGTPQNEYYAAVAEKMLTAVVTRVFNPGAKFDYTPVLVGRQDLAKSTLIATLAIKPQWFTDNLGDIENKDVILQMRSKLIIENAEMAMTTKKAITVQKSFLSRCVDRARLPYERLPRDVPRQCIFIGTTNEVKFLQDETGDRRFWPILVSKIDIAGVRKIINQLYAEALHLYEEGEFLFLRPEIEALAREKQLEHFAADEWHDEIESWLKTNKITFVTCKEIWTKCFSKFDVSSLSKRESTRIIRVLTSIGWHATVKRFGEKITRGYERNS